MAAINSRDLALQSETPRLISTSVLITGNASFSKPAFGGAITPSSIGLTATTSIFTSPTINWSYSNSIAPDSWTSLGTGSTKSITSTALATTASWVRVKAVATQSGYLDATTTTQLDAFQDAALPIITEVNPTSSVVIALFDGTATDFSATAASIRVKVGTSYINYAASGANSFSVAYDSQTPVGIVTGGSSFSGSGTTQCNIGAITGMVAGTDACSLIYTVTVRDLSGAIIQTSTVQRIITKSKSGTVGSSGLVVALTNDSVTIPTDLNGNNGVFTGSGTEIHVYEGDTELNYDGSGTTNGTFTVSRSGSSVTPGTLSDSGVFATLSDATAMSADIGYVSLTAIGKMTTGSSFNRTIRQNFSKAKAGTNPTAYRIYSPAACARSVDGTTFSPATIAFNAQSSTGSGAPAAYNGYWTVTSSTDGTTFSTTTTVTASVVSTVTITPSGTSIKSYRANLYSDSGRTTILDVETIPIVVDGATGDPGSTGDAGTSTLYAYAALTVSSIPTMPTGTKTTAAQAVPYGAAVTYNWSFSGTYPTWSSTVVGLSAGQIMVQSTGIYNPVTNQTVWSAPYLSSFKVGTLSALTTDTGTLIVGASGHIRGGQTAYNTGTGFFIGNESSTYKFSIGNSSTNKITFDGTNLTISTSGQSIFSGDLQANGSGTASDTIHWGASPKVGVDYSVFGNASSNPSTALGIRAGVFGKATNTTNSDFTVGVLGWSNRATVGVGVAGLSAGTNGIGGYFEGAAGVYGVSNAGGYAGYFAGLVYVGGNITATGNVTAYSSDIRLKNIESYIENAVEALSKLSCFRYTWNEIGRSFGYTDQVEIGLSAQETKEVFPEVVCLSGVNEDKDTDYLTMHYERLVPVLIQAVKELNIRIVELENKA